MRRTRLGTNGVLLAALCLTVLGGGSASAGLFGVTGPPNPYYCLNCENTVTQGGVLAQKLVIAGQTVQHTIEQIKMVQHMVTNLEKYGTSPLGLRHTQATVRNLFQSLKATTASGMNVAGSMNSLQGEYGDNYRDFAYYQQAQQGQWQGSTSDRSQWDTRYQDWSEQTHKKVLTPLETAKDLHEQMGDGEDQRLAQLQTQMSAAQGKSKLLESLAGLAALQVEQMQKLRGLLVLDMESKALYRAAMMERMSAHEAEMSTVRSEPTGIDPTFSQGMNWNASVR